MRGVKGPGTGDDGGWEERRKKFLTSIGTDGTDHHDQVLLLITVEQIHSITLEFTVHSR